MGRLVEFVGCSCSGKSTIIEKSLTSVCLQHLNLICVKKYLLRDFVNCNFTERNLNLLIEIKYLLKYTREILQTVCFLLKLREVRNLKISLYRKICVIRSLIRKFGLYLDINNDETYPENNMTLLHDEGIVQILHYICTDKNMDEICYILDKYFPDKESVCTLLKYIDIIVIYKISPIKLVERSKKRRDFSKRLRKYDNHQLLKIFSNTNKIYEKLQNLLVKYQIYKCVIFENSDFEYTKNLIVNECS